MKSQTILLLIAVFAISTVTKAENATQIIEKMINARGGIEKFSNIQNWYSEIELSGPQMPEAMQIKFWFKNPNKMKLEQQIMGQQITVSTNGKLAWMINPMAGSTDPQEIPSEQAASLTQIANILDVDVSSYNAEGMTSEYVEMADVDGNSYHKIKSSMGEEVIYLYIDPISNFLKRTEQTVSTPQGEMNQVTRFDEMQKVKGMIIPKTITVEINGNVAQTVNINSLKIDEGIEDSIFDMP